MGPRYGAFAWVAVTAPPVGQPHHGHTIALCSLPAGLERVSLGLGGVAVDHLSSADMTRKTWTEEVVAGGAGRDGGLQAEASKANNCGQRKLYASRGREEKWT